MAELVGGHALGQRRVPALGEQRVSVRDDGPDDTLAGVVLVAAAAARGREDEIVRLGFGVGMPVAEQLVAQRREDVDEPDAGLGLGVADGDPAVGEVDVLPRECRGLADAQAGVDERRDEGAPAGGARLRLRVELGGGVDHRRDLLG